MTENLDSRSHPMSIFSSAIPSRVELLTKLRAHQNLQLLHQLCIVLQIQQPLQALKPCGHTGLVLSSHTTCSSPLVSSQKRDAGA